MKLIFQNYQRKLISIFVAVSIWFVVNSTISTVRTFEKIPVHVIGIPSGKTLSNGDSEGFLHKRVDITLRGNKDIISRISPQDLEVTIDASNKGDEWIAKIGEHNISTNRTDINIKGALREATGSDCIVHLTPMVAAKIPIYITQPKGFAPEGFQFVDVFPRKLYHTVNLPQEEAARLENEGIEIEFDLRSISQEMLQKLVKDEMQLSDEVSFPVPDEWKMIKLPYLHTPSQIINAPEAKYLRIDFLVNRLLPYNGKLPITIFFPQSSIEQCNPTNFSLVTGNGIVEQKGSFFFTDPLFIHGVSRLFLHTVQDRMEIVVVPTCIHGKWEFTHSLQFINPDLLEESYVTLALANSSQEHNEELSLYAVRQKLMEEERNFRDRFRRYMHICKLYQDQKTPLQLKIKSIDPGLITIEKKQHTGPQ